ncbi:MAG: LysR family transcriptional regulator [Candidatus Lokiarchaeota archaeon]|nr:LysR family transcriptional regulator [Candidatus Lokiarchaeota archaeon]
MVIDSDILKKIRLEDLHVFEVLCRLKNYSAAAKKVDKTQGTISVDINKLEDTLGTELIHRTSKTFEVSKHGKEFLKFAKGTLHNFENMIARFNLSEKMEPKDYIGSISISSSSIPGEYILPRIMSHFKTKYANVEFIISITNSSEALHKLLNNDSDFAVVGFNPAEKTGDGIENEENIEFIPIAEDELVFICSNNHKILEKKNITLDDVYEFPFVLREEGSATRDRFISSKYYRKDIKVEFILNSNQSILSAILDTPFITILSKNTIQLIHGKNKKEPVNPLYKILQPKDYNSIKRNFYLVRRKDADLNPIGVIFWKQSKKIASK